MAWRNSGRPAIGAYWLRPASMWRCMASNSAGSACKSGKPCDRLIAPHISVANRLITVKMVVPHVREAGIDADRCFHDAGRFWGRGTMPQCAP